MSDHFRKANSTMSFPLSTMNIKMLQAIFNIMQSKYSFWTGLMRYGFDLMASSVSALKYFIEVEMSKAGEKSFLENTQDTMELFMLEMQIGTKCTIASISAMNDYNSREQKDIVSAFGNSLSHESANDLLEYSRRQLEIMEMLNHSYPRAIQDIESEYGFHFDNGGYAKAGETDRFELYQVLPTDKNVKVRERGKPMLIIPPYVLGANILAFLPGENKSYVHAFANQGIPTYIRVIKDISTSPAVQLMTGEDDASDMRSFSEHLVERHGKKVTLNGYCQGGFMSVIDILSGQLDGLVDALITAVAPLDGSRSKSLVDYIERLPFRYRDLGYAIKRLPNGNRVVDGKIMSWVFKLKSIESEAPFPSIYRDLMMFDGSGKKPRISKVAAAMTHWLTRDVADLPVNITRLSYDSFTKPVAEDGTLPVRLFGRPLNFKRITEKGIKWLICIAEGDVLVDQRAALAPLDFVSAEVAVFPKGHASMATSWSSPASLCSIGMMNMSECVLKSETALRKGSRGPVRFHIELDGAETTAK